MAITEYSFFIDESFQKFDDISFSIGGLLCSNRRAEIINNKVNSIREKYQYHKEIKWSEVGNLKDVEINFYDEIVSIVSSEKFWKFRILNIVKGVEWKKWEKSEEKRFEKSLYFFIVRFTYPINDMRYTIFYDMCSRYRIPGIANTINFVRRYKWNYKGRNIRKINLEDSKESNLIQITDLLIGIYADNPLTNKNKLLFRERSKNKLLGINIESIKWTPRVKEKKC